MLRTMSGARRPDMTRIRPISSFCGIRCPRSTVSSLTDDTLSAPRDRVRGGPPPRRARRSTHAAEHALDAIAVTVRHLIPPGLEIGPGGRGLVDVSGHLLHQLRRARPPAVRGARLIHDF